MQPVEIALDLALITMQNGGSTDLADRTFANVLGSCATADVSPVWRLDFVTVSSRSGPGAPAVMRPVGAIGMHLSRASEAAALSEQVAKGELDVACLPAEIERIKKLASPYTWWAMTLAGACAGACFSRTAGGDWGALGVALVAAGVGQFARVLLQAVNFPRIPVTAISALISVFLATAGLRLGFTHVAPATLIGSVVYMVPGVALINGFVDIIAGKHLFVGIQRLFDAGVVCLILAIAMAIADAAL
jgi:uncharacterized membrane protein YjjP (DUF1212 family)